MENLTVYKTDGPHRGAWMPAACALGVALLMCGCQSTLHSRYALASDSRKNWAPRMDALPVEVHGTAPGATPAQALARVPMGVADIDSGTPRVVMYMGGTQLPVNHTYCTRPPTLRSVEVINDRVLIGAALCDGSRLVVTERQELASSDLDEAHMAKTVQETKARLMEAVGNARDWRKAPYAGE